MANEININVGATEDASQVIGNVASSTGRAEKVIVKSMGSASEAFDSSAKASGKFGARIGKVTEGAGQLGDASDSVGSIIDSVGNVMSKTTREAEALAQAQLDVEQAAVDAEQAVLDLSQAVRDEAQSVIDASQAGIDLEQALLDQTTAQEEYNAAVKKFGANSEEAKQAQLDLKQAQLDATQAGEDALQAQEDMEQAQLDSQQATVDNAQAQKDLANAQRELTKQGSDVQGFSNILTGLSGIIGLITVAQIAWNIAMTANPIGVVIMAVAALVAGIIWLATQTTFFQDRWNEMATGFMFAVEKIKQGFAVFVDFTRNLFTKLIAGFQAIPDRIRSAFSGLGNILMAPFKWAFNSISGMWNRTVGRLSWSVPGWVPGIGGNSISAPRLPTLQHGGEIMRTGAVLAHKGEKIMPASTRGLFNDISSGRALKIIFEIIGGHDSFQQFVKENVKIYGAGDVEVAYNQ